MRSLLPLPLLLASCQKGSVSQRPPTSAELARVMGTVQTLEITPPKGARSFALSWGPSGSLENFLKHGRLPLTAGLLQTGCPDGQYRLALVTGSSTNSLCLKLTSAYGTTASLSTAGKPLPLDRWVPVYAVQPTVPGKEAGSQIMDENPAHWTLVSVYFSDQTDADPRKLPPDTTAVELLR